MDFVYKINEALLDFYINHAPNALKESLFQIYFIEIVDACLVVFILGAVYLSIRKYKDQRKKEKILVISMAILANVLVLFAGINNNKNSLPKNLLAFILLNFIFYFIYKAGDWFKKLNIETRLDGNLNLKKTDSKYDNIINCPRCNYKTISYRHAMRETQTCGECGKSFKVKRSKTIEIALSLLMLITFCLGFYLRAKCDVNGFISLAVMLSGFIVLTFYQLKPKELLEVEELKKS